MSRSVRTDVGIKSVSDIVDLMSKRLMVKRLCEACVVGVVVAWRSDAQN